MRRTFGSPLGVFSLGTASKMRLPRANGSPSTPRTPNRRLTVCLEWLALILDIRQVAAVDPRTTYRSAINRLCRHLSHSAGCLTGYMRSGFSLANKTRRASVTCIGICRSAAWCWPAVRCRPAVDPSGAGSAPKLVPRPFFRCPPLCLIANRLLAPASGAVSPAGYVMAPGAQRSPI